MLEIIIQQQKDFYQQNKTLDYHFRINALKKLKSLIKKYEDELTQSVYQDLNKSAYETYLSELSLVYSEINYALKHLRSWMKTKKVYTFVGKTYLMNEPFGSVLVISPWNYPLQLSLVPVIAAIAAGNVCILKPSSQSQNASLKLMKMLNDEFDQNLVYVSLEPNHKELNYRYDYIFFTGSEEVGRKVMLKASQDLTPLTLELGGKSPCIIDKDADLSLATKRIIFAKLLNSGQTCIAPDYIYVHQSVKDAFIKELIRYYQKFYPLGINSPTYPKIITSRHYNRLLGLLADTKVIYGKEKDDKQLKLGLTLVEGDFKQKVMQEEIFGPIFPIFTFDNIEEVITKLKTKEKPLALYLFSNNKNNINKVTKSLSFGSGAINDAVVQISSLRVPFGGVGNSGMGKYHGKYGFTTFSRTKPVLKGRKLIDISLKYPPYTKIKEKIIRLIYR